MFVHIFYYLLFIVLFFFAVWCPSSVSFRGLQSSFLQPVTSQWVFRTLPRIWNRRILCSMMTEYQRSLCKTSDFVHLFVLKRFLKPPLEKEEKAGYFGALKAIKELGTCLRKFVFFVRSFSHKVFADSSSIRFVNSTKPRISWLIHTFLWWCSKSD